MGAFREMLWHLEKDSWGIKEMATLQLNDIKACYRLYLKEAKPPVSRGESGVPPRGWYLSGEYITLSW